MNAFLYFGEAILPLGGWIWAGLAWRYLEDREPTKAGLAAIASSVCWLFFAIHIAKLI